MSDPNRILQQTQTTVMRAVAAQARHSELVGQLLGEEAAQAELDALYERVRALEAERGRFVDMVIERFAAKLRPIIRERRELLHRTTQAGAAWDSGYAQALDDFLAGRLTA